MGLFMFFHPEGFSPCKRVLENLVQTTSQSLLLFFSEQFQVVAYVTKLVWGFFLKNFKKNRFPQPTVPNQNPDQNFESDYVDPSLKVEKPFWPVLTEIPSLTEKFLVKPTGPLCDLQVHFEKRFLDDLIVHPGKPIF